MTVAGLRGFFRSIRGGLVGSALLLAWDGAINASFLLSLLFCPVWFVFNLVRGAIDRPGWGLALARVAIPAATLGLVWANHVIQIGITETNARRVIAACEAYHDANGKYPQKLGELVPQYLDAVPMAKYCLGPGSLFSYHNNGKPLLYWQVFGFLRRIYNFEEHRWSYLD